MLITSTLPLTSTLLSPLPFILSSPLGTANGGSALLWASIMHLSEMKDSKIVTIDVVEPKWEEGQVGWGGTARWVGSCREGAARVAVRCWKERERPGR